MTEDHNYTAENADESQPASTLHTEYTCGECGKEFDSHDELGRHTVHCNGEAGDDDD